MQLSVFPRGGTVCKCLFLLYIIINMMKNEYEEYIRKGVRKGSIYISL